MSYIVYDPEMMQLAIINPVLDYDPIWGCYFPGGETMQLYTSLQKMLELSEDMRLSLSASNPSLLVVETVSALRRCIFSAITSTHYSIHIFTWIVRDMY
ncbi:MAG: hypothetical protein ACKVK8_11225 [Rhodospirillales bacterium]